MVTDLKGKWALVTGASRGIGREISRALAGLGCNLVLHSRSTEHTHHLAEELSARGISTVSLQADLSRTLLVNRLITDIHSHVPRIDLLYNNAAIMLPYNEQVCTISSEAYRESFETNVISPIKLCNALVPGMIERRWGRIINLVSGISGQPQLAPYAVSKAALQKYTYDFACVLEDSTVSINALDPGWLQTDMGGTDAPNPLDSVIPGALMPALLPASANGRTFRAQDYRGMSIEQALDAAICED